MNGFFFDEWGKSYFDKWDKSHFYLLFHFLMNGINPIPIHLFDEWDKTYFD